MTVPNNLYFTLISCFTVIFWLFPQKNIVLAQSGQNNITWNKEPHRPAFHFCPDSMWMNDPNGMFYADGTYHLFYQYYPKATVWGPMHWGHATSSDLINWQHLPIALYPDSLGYIFSGSAVVDTKNTSGFGKNDVPPVIAFFTHHHDAKEKSGSHQFQYQSMAYSVDGGKTFTKYAGNPVVPNPGIRDFRDPKVFWYEDDQSWKMIFAAYDHVRIYTSKNLIDWSYCSSFGKDFGCHEGVWECPDLFPLKAENTGQIKWVMLVSINPGAPNGGSGTQYFVGEFDGCHFKTEDISNPAENNTRTQWLDFGTDNYAGVTWSGIPEKDGRKIFLGWMSNWKYAQQVPTEQWRSSMTLPRQLTLESLEGEWIIKSNPVGEFSQLEYGSNYVFREQTIGNEMKLQSGSVLNRYQLEIDNPLLSTVFIRLSNDMGQYTDIGFDGHLNKFFIDRRFSGITDFNENFAAIQYSSIRKKSGNIKIDIIQDVSGIEMFADDGKIVMTSLFFPSQPYHKATIVSTDSALKFGGTVRQLKPAIFNSVR